MVHRKDLPAETKKKIQDFFVNCGKECRRRAQKRKIPDHADLPGLPRVVGPRSCCRSARSSWPTRKSKIETDTTLAAADTKSAG